MALQENPVAYWEPLPGCGHGIIRVFLDGAKPFGSPYDLSLLAVADDGGADLRALVSDDKVTPAVQRAIFGALRRRGFRRVTWTRRKVQPDGTINTRRMVWPLTQGVA